MNPRLFFELNFWLACISLVGGLSTSIALKWSSLIRQTSNAAQAPTSAQKEEPLHSSTPAAAREHIFAAIDAFIDEEHIGAKPVEGFQKKLEEEFKRISKQTG